MASASILVEFSKRGQALFHSLAWQKTRFLPHFIVVRVKRMNLLRKYPQWVGKIQRSFFSVRSGKAENYYFDADALPKKDAGRSVYLPSRGEKSADRFSWLKWSASCSNARRGMFYMAMIKSPPYKDVYVAIRDAFKTARRKLQVYAHRQNGAVKHHETHDQENLYSD